MNAIPIARQDVEKALAKILESAEFQSAPLRARFLEYVVLETLEGRANRLKGTAIAIDVYGRDADFDQQTDPIVRVEARRIRRDLEHYYLTKGASDDVVIEIPKGGYTPIFKHRPTATENGVGATDEPYPEATQAEAAPNAPVIGSGSNDGTAIATGRPRALFVVPVALIAILLAVLWWSQQSTVSVDPASAGPQLFVLPFESTYRAPAEAALAKGITLEIVDRLSPFKGFEVYPVSAAYPLDTMIADAGDKVAFTLDGFVQVSGEEVRITAKLQRAEDGQHIWSDRYSATFTPDRIFEIQDLIARNVIGRLAESHGLLGEFSLRELAASPSPSLPSYECVLLGYQYRATFSRKLHAESRDCLERVIRANPEYARAWALLAYIYADEYRFFYNTRPDARQRCLNAARMAVELDPDDALSHQAVSIALFGDGQVEAALTAARAAIDLNPHNHVALMQLGYRTFATGRWEEAAQIVNEAVTKTVSPPGWYPWVVALLRVREGDYETARVLAESETIPQFALFEATRAAIYGQLGKTGLAELSLDRTRQLDPQFDSRALEWFTVQRFPDDLLNPIVEGLRKAGLQPD